MGIERELLYVMTSSVIGEGAPDLGTKLVESFFKALIEGESLPAKIIFVNSGIFLTTTGSPVAGYLQQLERQGTELVSCTTCLNYFERIDKLLVGRPGDMKDTVGSFAAFKKVVTF